MTTPPFDFSLFPLLFLIVPAIMGVAAALMLFRQARQLGAVRHVQRVGQRATGIVIGSHVHLSGGGNSSRAHSRLVETIEYRTLAGQTVRASPLAGDIGMFDRTGQEVPVIYDPERPESFVAPKNGQSVSSAGALTSMVITVVVLVFVVVFVVTSQGMFRSSGLFG